ncbi:MAG: M20/M25/M40 family metallo-hydrolase, partial [Patescibacteria group bacterium]
MLMLRDSKNKVLEFKNDLNKIAELGWKEFRTRDYVLGKLGGDFVWSDKTALVYKIGEGVPIFFRAELDALNTVSGPKHICGHSSHLSALMATYLYLKENPIQGYSIYFVFQPSEESYPSGAEFISKNFPEIRKCQAGFAFHTMPKYKAGELADPTFAFADYFEIKIKGKATHIKYKNENKVDALLVGAELLQSINKKRNKDFIINAGSFSGGDVPNKIAGEAKLSGDVRGFDPKYSKIGKDFLKKICADIQKKYPGINVSLYHNPSCPSFKNDIKISYGLKRVLGVKKDFKSFGTEDFSHYPVRKGFLLIGTGRKEELHSDNFFVPDAVTLKIFDNWLKISQNLDLI